MRLLLACQWVPEDADLDELVAAMRPRKVDGTDAYGFLYGPGDPAAEEMYQQIAKTHERLPLDSSEDPGPDPSPTGGSTAG